MFYTRIPVERVGVLVGEGGQTKTRLEEMTGIKVIVDSKTGEVTIDESEAKDPTSSLKVRDVVTAIGRGFSEEKAFLLMDDDVYLQTFDIKESAGDNKGRIAQIKGRVIGSGGKTRRLVEELAGVYMSVYGHTVALIGEAFHLDIARQAVEMLLGGSEHKTVYRFLERKRQEIKAYDMGF
jgi:ribosomal RNA assembly protein